MPTQSLDVLGLVSPDQQATEIARQFDQWKHDMGPFIEESIEIRNYVFATDTKTTTNSKLPFSNSTTIPKLNQIAMNLKANYMSHLFPNPTTNEWINWEAHNEEAALVEKRRSIESYIRTKARQQDMIGVNDKILDDWVLTGNGFGRLDYIREQIEDRDGNIVPGYIGPRLSRVSMYDLVFNIHAPSFERAPKIYRSLKSMGDLARDMIEKPELGMTQEIMNLMRDHRIAVRNTKRINKSDSDKSRGLIADGFADISQYYTSGFVEVLDFYGDWYDQDTGEYLKDHVITVVDRAFIIRKEPINTWNGKAPFYHVAWRKRPDNLMGMSPLANLVGMQYKLDKLENVRADVWDEFAHPVTVEKGDVEFFGERGAPGGRYIAEIQGDVQFLRPDATALSADIQIAQTMQLMEEMAGAPREAMGIRSPGEKTKFEVQVLDNAANRIFRERVKSYEREFLTVVLNDMLLMARQNLDGSDLIRAEDSTFGTDQFLQVTREDLTAGGKLYASGASHFEKQANAVQNLNAIFNSNMGQTILPHISRIQLAKVVEDLLSSEQFNLVQENIGILEDIKSQQIAQQGQIDNEEAAMTPSDIEGEEPV